jgi:hypothetical protein
MFQVRCNGVITANNLICSPLSRIVKLLTKSPLLCELGYRKLIKIDKN